MAALLNVVFMGLALISILILEASSFYHTSTVVRVAWRSSSPAQFGSKLLTSDSVADDIFDKVSAHLLSKGDELKPIIAASHSFMYEYAISCLDAGEAASAIESNIIKFFSYVALNTASPHAFEPFHKAVRSPFDFYTWGNNFFRPLIIKEQSRLLGREHADAIKQLLEKGDNVVILSNHQTEVDPQVLSILLADQGETELAQRMIFVAGHKVTSDPVAIPFSIGRNLICIHSKKHIRNPPDPELVQQKQAQNMKSLKEMFALMAEGGHVFWVAPSGGRDRPDEEGRFAVAPFDFKNLDTFKIISMQARKPLHFFPMAMYTHQLVPPPNTVSSDLGEERTAKRGAVSVHFLPETDGVGSLKDKEFSADVEATVVAAYKELSKWHREKAGLPL